jgi:HK97 family phage major capsid protein
MASEVIDRMVEQRARDWNEASTLITAASTAGRVFTIEETARYDQLIAAVDEATASIAAESNRAAGHAARDAALNQVVTETRVLPGGDRTVTRAVVITSTEEYETAFRNYLIGGMGALDPEERKLMAAGRSTLAPGEQRAAQTVTTTGGGYVIPQGFYAKLVTEMKKFGNVRGVATIMPTSDGGPLELPTVADTGTMGRLLTINTALTDTAIVFGHVTFQSYMYTSDVILVPWQLAQDWGAEPLEGWIARIAGERVGRITNNHFTVGTGTNQPQGIVTGASSAATAAGSTAVTYGDLLTLLHSVDPAYREVSAGWMFNDQSLLKLRLLTDDIGRPLWQPGVAADAPNTLLGYPYQVNQDMAAMTSGLKPILFGNLSYYYVREVATPTMVRLDERYADALQTGYFVFERVDGRLVDPGVDPVKFLTMA